MAPGRGRQGRQLPPKPVLIKDTAPRIAPPITIPLRPLANPVEPRDDFVDHIKHEYMVHYLEGIGVAPTRANLEMVKKHVPKSELVITWAWKSRGWPSDQIYVSHVAESAASSADTESLARAAQGRGGEAEAKAPTALALAAPENQGLPEELMTLLGAEDEEEERKRARRAAAEASSAISQQLRTSAGTPLAFPTFAEIRERFVHPFSLPAEAIRARRASAERARRRAGGTPDFRARLEAVFPTYTHDEVLAELVTPLVLHTKDVLASLSSFAAVFPLHLLATKLEPSERAQLGAMLTGAQYARFVGLVTVWAYESHMAQWRDPAAHARMRARAFEARRARASALAAAGADAPAAAPEEEEEAESWADGAGGGSCGGSVGERSGGSFGTARPDSPQPPPSAGGASGAGGTAPSPPSAERSGSGGGASGRGGGGSAAPRHVSVGGGGVHGEASAESGADSVGRPEVGAAGSSLLRQRSSGASALRAAPPLRRGVSAVSARSVSTHARAAAHAPPSAAVPSLLAAIQHDFVALQRPLRKRRERLLHGLPILLLGLRVAVDVLLRHSYPKWWSTLHGADTLAVVQEAITQLFDPERYHSRLSVVMSTTAAVTATLAHRSEEAPAQRQAHYHTTSNLTRLAIPDAAYARLPPSEQVSVPARVSREIAASIEPNERARQHVHALALQQVAPAPSKTGPTGRVLPAAGGPPLPPGLAPHASPDAMRAHAAHTDRAVRRLILPRSLASTSSANAARTVPVEQHIERARAARSRSERTWRGAGPGMDAYAAALAAAAAPAADDGGGRSVTMAAEAPAAAAAAERGDDEDLDDELFRQADARGGGDSFSRGSTWRATAGGNRRRGAGSAAGSQRAAATRLGSGASGTVRQRMQLQRQRSVRSEGRR